MPKQHIWILLCHNIGPLTILYLNYFNNYTQLPFLTTQIINVFWLKSGFQIVAHLSTMRKTLIGCGMSQSKIELRASVWELCFRQFLRTLPFGDPTREFRQYFSENSTALTRGIESLECSAGNMEWISSDRLIVVTNLGRNFAGVK